MQSYLDMWCPAVIYVIVTAFSYIYNGDRTRSYLASHNINVFIYSYYILQGTSIEKAPIDRDTSRTNDEDDDEDDEAEDFPLH